MVQHGQRGPATPPGAANAPATPLTDAEFAEAAAAEQQAALAAGDAALHATDCQAAVAAYTRVLRAAAGGCCAAAACNARLGRAAALVACGAWRRALDDAEEAAEEAGDGRGERWRALGEAVRCGKAGCADAAARTSLLELLARR